MTTAISDIIGNEGEKDLRKDFNDAILSEGTTIGDIEDLLLGYGLELDYLESLLF
jgi:hypothetical protein